MHAFLLLLIHATCMMYNPFPIMECAGTMDIKQAKNSTIDVKNQDSPMYCEARQFRQDSTNIPHTKQVGSVTANVWFYKICVAKITPYFIICSTKWFQLHWAQQSCSCLESNAIHTIPHMEWQAMSETGPSRANNGNSQHLFDDCNYCCKAAYHQIKPSAQQNKDFLENQQISQQYSKNKHLYST